jgi:hypothetical protein
VAKDVAFADEISGGAAVDKNACSKLPVTDALSMLFHFTTKHCLI